MWEAVDLLMGASKGLAYTGVTLSRPGVETSRSEQAEVALAGVWRGETERAPLAGAGQRTCLLWTVLLSCSGAGGQTCQRAGDSCHYRH